MIPVLLALPFLLQDAEAAARKILEASALTLRKAAAVTFEAKITTMTPSLGGRVTDTRFTVQHPNLLRIETDGPNSFSQVISDGRMITWLYRQGGSHEYTQDPFSPSEATRRIPQDPVLALYLGPGVIDGFHLADELKAGRENLDGEECDVVSGTFGLADPYGSDWNKVRQFRIWFGRDRLPRKFVRMEEGRKLDLTYSAVYSKFDLAAKPAEGTFAFKPPEGSKHLNRKLNQTEDLPKTPAGQKAQEILAAVHKELRRLESVQYQFDRSRITLRRPRQLRIDRGEPGWSPSLIVDGASRFHVDELNKLIRAEDPSSADILADVRRSQDAVIQLFFQEGAPLLLAGATDVTVEPVPVGGETCDRLEWTSFASKGAFRLWIGPDRRIRRFARSTGVYSHDPTDGTQSYKITGWATSVYRSFDAAPKISDDFFAFSPPSGWRDTRREVRPAAGSPAPDFDVVDRDGKRARLADFRGKPLALVFLGDHYPPRFDAVQKAHAEFGPQGVAVVGVFIGREKPDYDPAKHTFRLLTPADDSLVRAYAVLDSGDVLIDSKGRIAFAGTITNPDRLGAGLKRLR